MRQIWITKAGPPEVLKVQESADPVAGPGQVRIRVKASGINFADLVARTGMYRDAPPIPCVIGYEVSGIVDEIGAGVTTVKTGDRVFGMPFFGGYSDTVVLPAEQAIQMPAGMSFEEAAALPVVYLTAHHTMLYTGALRPGMKVLIYSAAGGVGLAAIDLAKAAGCEILGAASPGKHDFLKGRGVHHTLDGNGDVPSQVGAIAGKHGVDLILDAVGGKSWGQNYKLLGLGGRLVCFGISTMTPGKSRSLWSALAMIFSMKWFTPVGLMMENRGVCGVNMASFFDRTDLVLPQFKSLLDMYAKGQIKPYVDKSFKFDDAPSAHHYLHDRKAKGKVLLVP